MTGLSLSGEWEFLPADARRDELPDQLPERITVPGLWEAQGHVDLDGPAWYRRHFALPANDLGWWTLRFGAVMDDCTVHLNGRLLGGHVGGFTPFELDASSAVREGDNVLEVRVVDHPRDSAEHDRSAHGKQGWMNHVFPSPDSLYLTYGGIWQDVELVPHAQLRIRDVVVRPDPDDVVVEVEVDNVGPTAEPAVVVVDVLGLHLTVEESVAAGERQRFRFAIGRTEASPWSPATPVLHHAVVTVGAEQRDVRFGLRTFRVDGSRFVLNGEPFPIRSALVQGFYAGTLYAEGTREAIEAEVRGAAAAGLTMLRLHIKAFDPTYLDVCDELGMLVHADIPVAEPIAHAELDGSGEVVERCAAALVEQVRRDRNHPSLVLWSVMNELGAELLPSRQSAGYEAFARRLYGEAVAADPTRPVIENDWIEPDPDEVFCSPILTAHWYGRLSADYLAALDAKVSHFAALGRPLFVSEFGDWGLPPLDREDTSPFWWAGDRLRARIESLPWSGSAEEFVAGTQRYQGISDRLQVEVFRVHELSGWCVTELTDVPQEYNGLWDLDRRPKPAALEQVGRACQPVLPIAQRQSWAVRADDKLGLPVHVDNGSAYAGAATLQVRVDGLTLAAHSIELSPYSVTSLGELQVELPGTVGRCRLELVVETADGRSSNDYEVLCLDRPVLDRGVDLAYAGELAAVVRDLGGRHAPAGPLLVAEGGLANAWQAVRDAIATGRDVVVLAQDAAAALLLPFSTARGVDVRTEWGSTPFVFSTGLPGLSALAGAAVLSTQALTVMPTTVWTDLGGSPWAARPLVGLYKPYPGEIVGTVVGSVPVGASQIWLCQLPLMAPALEGDPVALSVLADLLTLAGR